MILQIFDDFELDRIAESGQCFRWTKTGGSAYRVIAKGSCLYIKAIENGCYDLDCSEEEYYSFWNDYFDLQEDYRSIREKIDPEKDPFLWEAAGQEKGIRILKQDPWETLITFIISQNKNIPGICGCVESLSEKCGGKKMDSKGKHYYAFPEPAEILALSENDLTACKLGYRAKYVYAAAKAVMSGEIDLNSLSEADEETAISELTGLFGVGNKVASCVSLFGLHHLNAFPIDVWVKRILAQEYPDGYPYDQYSPYNGVYQQYMFAYYRHREAAGRVVDLHAFDDAYYRHREAAANKRACEKKGSKNVQTGTIME